MRELRLSNSTGWDENQARKIGLIEPRSEVQTDWQQVILQGPHLTVSNPIVKEPNSTMKNNSDWSEIDLENLSVDFIPRSSYQRAKPMSDYKSAYTRWGQEKHYAADFYRVGWRYMAATTGVRTLHVAIIPPGPAHIQGILSVGSAEAGALEKLALLAASWSSLPIDFMVKSSGVANLSFGVMDRLPVIDAGPLIDQLLVRTLRLNCIVAPYAQLWDELYRDTFAQIDWVAGRTRARRPSLGIETPVWDQSVPLRKAEDRRVAQLEIDAIVAVALGLTADELCTIYGTQFPVLHGYERNDLYDANGRKVPGEMNKLYRQHAESLNEEQRTWLHSQSGVTYVFEFPFVGFDREADMRTAHAHFSKLMEEMD